MIVRIYQCDGRFSHSLLHAICVAELQMSESEFNQTEDILLQEYDGDFFTFNEPMAGAACVAANRL